MGYGLERRGGVEEQGWSPRVSHYTVENKNYPRNIVGGEPWESTTTSSALQLTNEPSSDNMECRWETEPRMVESSITRGMSKDQPKLTGIGGQAADPLKDTARESELHEVRVQAWEYIVEQPDSPATSEDTSNIPTSLSPLIQKINLKRKHEENYESREMGLSSE